MSWIVTMCYCKELNVGSSYMTDYNLLHGSKHLLAYFLLWPLFFAEKKINTLTEQMCLETPTQSICQAVL